jgi:hypothetical protein
MWWYYYSAAALLVAPSAAVLSAAAASEDDQCRLYLAESTIPGGEFTTIDLFIYLSQLNSHNKYAQHIVSLIIIVTTTTTII